MLWRPVGKQRERIIHRLLRPCLRQELLKFHCHLLPRPWVLWTAHRVVMELAIHVHSRLRPLRSVMMIPLTSIITFR